MTMLYYELKKIVVRPANKIAFLILAVMLCLVSYFTVKDVEYVDENGHSSFGIAAARALRAQKSQWEGEITEEVLVKVLEENARINRSAEALSDDYMEQNKAYAKKQGYSDIREMINHAFSRFKEYDYFRIDSVTKEEILSFYDRRVSNLKEWLDTGGGAGVYSEQEEQYLISQYEKLKSPIYYEDADGWETMLEYASVLIMLFVLAAGFLVAGIFSDEIQLKADSVFFSSKLGRDKAIAAKIGAGLLLITAVYWIMLLFYTGISLAVLGAGGADCVIQSGFKYWRSLYNLTYLQAYLLTLVGGYLGNLFILTLSMLASAKARSKAFAATVPFILLFIPSFLSDVQALSEILGLLPNQLLQVSEAVRSLELYQIGGKVFGSVPVLFAGYFVLWGILLPVLYLGYRKMEVK